MYGAGNCWLRFVFVSSVEAVLSRQHELSESSKDNIRSTVTSTLQSASLPNSNLTPDEQKALKRLKTDENIVILPAEKGRVTVVMDKTDYNDKMDSLANDICCVNRTETVHGTLRLFPVFVSPIVLNMGENLHYESVVYFRATQRARILSTYNIQNGGSCSVNYY